MGLFSGTLAGGNGLGGAGGGSTGEADRTITEITSAVDYEITSIVENTIYKIDPSGSSITITIPDTTDAVKHCKFILVGTSGDFTVVTSGGQNIGGETSQPVTTFNKGFEVTENSTGYIVTQDSRPSDANVAITFLPTDTASLLEPTYSVLETESQAQEGVTSVAITSSDELNPTSLGFWINDNKALVGTVPENEIIATAYIKLASTYNRKVKFKFKYYEYNYETSTLNPTALLETSYSSWVDETTTEQKVVTGTLPSNAWADTDTVGYTLVIELLAYKDAAAGDSPQIVFTTGGSTPSKTAINVPVASVSHDSLGAVLNVGSGVDKGHLSDGAETIYGEKTFDSMPKIPVTDPTEDANPISKAYFDANAGGGAFTTTSNVTSNSVGSYSSDDFVFGSPQLDDDSNTTHDRRFFFDKSKGATRLGICADDSWNDVNRGNASFAGGDRAVASGNTSFAYGGNLTEASGLYTVAFMDGKGSNNYAVGMSKGIASGQYSFCFGANSSATQSFSMSFGFDADALAEHAICLGNGNRVNGVSGFAVNKFTTSHDFCESVLGQYNIVSVGNQTSWVATDSLFIIGNGTEDGSRSNALQILKNGKHYISDLKTTTSHPANYKSLFVDTDSGLLYSQDASGGGGAFTTTSNVTSNSEGSYALDDFVFGSPSLDDDGNTDHDVRMFFDKSKGAFRAGFATSTQWNDSNRGLYSVAIGANTTASGDFSTAFGASTTASGDGSNSFGYLYENNQQHSLTIGYGIGSTDTTGVKIRLEADADQDNSKKGAIYIADTTAPTTTTNRLYAVGGNLYWNGVQIN